jgi:hypothetical protein
MLRVRFTFGTTGVQSAAPGGPATAQTIRDQVRRSIQDAAQQARDAAQEARDGQQSVRDAQQQVRDVQQQLRDAERQLRNATTADERSAAEQGLAGTQEALREAEAALREAEAQVRVSPRVVFHTAQLPPDLQHLIPPQAVDIALGFFIMCAVMVIGWPLARAFGRRIEQRGESAALDSSVGVQLQRIEQAVEAMAIEIERISESQRFMAKLQNGSAQEHATLPERR